MYYKGVDPFSILGHKTAGPNTCAMILWGCNLFYPIPTFTRYQNLHIFLPETEATLLVPI